MGCEKCKTDLLIYQKDGSGMLKRLYFDRIVNIGNLGEGNLLCTKCKMVLGVPIVYEKENRPAYRLFAGAVSKKIISKF